MVDVNDISFLLQVVVVTHAYGDRSGVRYLTNYLKVFSSASLLLCRVHYQILSPFNYHVYCFFCFDHRCIILQLFSLVSFFLIFFFLFQVYYLPFGPFHNQCVLPTLYTTLPLMRCILLRERITIVHGHSVSY